MKSPRITHEPAFVLHRYNWSESSLILELWTRHFGRIAVMAKGARRPYSQLRPILLPFQPVQVNFSGDAEVRTLRGAEWAGGHAMVTGAALLMGFYLNELLIKLMARDDPHPQLFDAYALTLRSLATERDDAGVQAGLRAFEVVLLQALGVLPQLDVVTQTQQPVLAEGRYRIHPEMGVGAIEPEFDTEPALSGATLLALQEGLQALTARRASEDDPARDAAFARLRQSCAGALPELKATLRRLLHYHLGTPQLATRRLMMELQSK